MTFSLTELAGLVGGKVSGDGSLKTTILSPVDNIAPGSLVFADGAENIARAEASEALALLTRDNGATLVKPAVLVANPMRAFLQLISHFYPPEAPEFGIIHPGAVIAEDVKIGQNVAIGAGVVIGRGTVIGDFVELKPHVCLGSNVVIGNHVVLHPQVTVYANSIIGNRVIIHASSVVGSDGFGYMEENGQHIKVPHAGNVIIEDDVEIGANTVVDRATLGSTVIGKGTKIDNLVQIAHSVKLGRHNILCAFTGIAGSTKSGNNVIFAANTGVSDHVVIDDGVILGARAGVPPKKHLLAGNIYLGSPARPRKKAIEHELSLGKIPLMRKNMQAMREEIAALKTRLATLEEGK